MNDGLQLARRLGNEGWVQTFGGLISAVGKRTGNWDEALAVGDATMAGATDARTRSVAIEDIATIRAFRGESIDHYVTELDATAALDGGDITRRIAAATKCAAALRRRRSRRGSRRMEAPGRGGSHVCAELRRAAGSNRAVGWGCR